MSILGSIMSSILGSRAGVPSAPPAAQAHRDEGRGATDSTPIPTPTSEAKPATKEKPPAMTPPAASGAVEVDIAAVLDKRAAKAGQKLDWRRSIVDLMKLLEMDSGQDARRKLAQELSYTGDTKDSAVMNVWLHKEVMRKLTEHGGKVPPDLVRH